MLYCFNDKNFDNLPRTNREIAYALAHNSFIYYDENENVFKDYNDNIVDVNGIKVIPSSFVLQLPNMINALIKNGAIIPNTLEDINKVEEWYNYFETQRLIVPFTGKDLQDPEFLSYLYEVFNRNPEVFLKTKKKDFNGIIDLTELFDKNSDLRKAISYHEDEEFILSEKVEVNQDELGQEEYRVFIYKNRIMNISRITDSTYHQIPEDLIEYIYSVLERRPSNFPSTFVLDIFSYQHLYDILEMNPFEASGKYLYNSIFSFSEDLTHQDIEQLPEEKDKSKVSYDKEEKLVPSTLKKVQGSFAKDYDDIKRYGKRIEGFVHVYGLPEGIKINIDELFNNATLFSDDDLDNNQDKPKSLTKE